MYVCMYACKLVVALLFFFSYIYTHSYSLDPVTEHECAFCTILYLNFYESHAPHMVDAKQAVIFVRSSLHFLFILYVKSRSSLCIRFSIMHISFVQLSTKHKSYIHTHLLICLKLKREN